MKYALPTKKEVQDLLDAIAEKQYMDRETFEEYSLYIDKEDRFKELLERKMVQAVDDQWYKEYRQSRGGV